MGNEMTEYAQVYFRVTNQEAVSLVERSIAEINEFRSKAFALAEEYGFKAIHESGGRLVGFSDNRQFKAAFRNSKKSGFWVPETRNEQGRSAAARMEAISFTPPSDALNVLFGLKALHVPGKILRPVWGYVNKVLLASVPVTNECAQANKLLYTEGFELIDQMTFLQLKQAILPKKEG